MPETRTKPDQFQLRLPDGMRAELKEAAKENGRSLNSELIARLSGLDTVGLRDRFAGQIAAGMAAHSGTSGLAYGPGSIADRSYEVADAMLAAREAR